MAAIYRFMCRSCKHECVSSIGSEASTHFSTVAMACSACADISTYKIPNRIGIDDSFDHRLICKNCHSGEHLKEWDGISCPHCQKPMRAVGSDIKTLKPRRDY